MNTGKIIWAICEIGTLGLGTGLLLSNILGSYHPSDELVVSSLLTATGIIMISWRRDVFSKK